MGTIIWAVAASRRCMLVNAKINTLKMHPWFETSSTNTGLYPDSLDTLSDLTPDQEKLSKKIEKKLSRRKKGRNLQ